MLELIIGQIPEAIFFSLFMIYAKGIKEKRILFVILMVVEYLLIMQNIYFNTYSHVIYTILTFLTLKVLYKEKCQVTDIFTFGIASLIMILSNFIIYMFVWKLFNIFMIYAILHRIFLIIFMIIFHNKLNNIQKIYKKLWNRNDKVNKRIKSTTFRSLNIIAFNIMFYIINLGMIFMLIQNGGV